MPVSSCQCRVSCTTRPPLERIAAWSTFYLAAHKAARLAEQRVCVVDEVSSTGSTLRALRSLALRSGCASVRAIVIATEGETDQDVVAFAHLPVFT